MTFRQHLWKQSAAKLIPYLPFVLSWAWDFSIQFWIRHSRKPVMHSIEPWILLPTVNSFLILNTTKSELYIRLTTLNSGLIGNTTSSSQNSEFSSALEHHRFRDLHLYPALHFYTKLWTRLHALERTSAYSKLLILNSSPNSEFISEFKIWI